MIDLVIDEWTCDQYLLWSYWVQLILQTYLYLIWTRNQKASLWTCNQWLILQSMYHHWSELVIWQLNLQSMSELVILLITIDLANILVLDLNSRSKTGPVNSLSMIGLVIVDWSDNQDLFRSIWTLCDWCTCNLTKYFTSYLVSIQTTIDQWSTLIWTRKLKLHRPVQSLVDPTSLIDRATRLSQTDDFATRST